MRQLLPIALLVLILSACSTCVENTTNGLPNDQAGVVTIERTGQTIGGLPNAYTSEDDPFLFSADMGAGGDD